MKPEIKLTEINTPLGGVRKYNPAFRSMPLEDIEKQEQTDLQSYAEAGYNSFTFHRSTGTISINRIEIKTLADVFKPTNTDY